MQPLDNGIFNQLKGRFEQYSGELSSFTESSPLGKINFIRCLFKARSAVSESTIKGAFRHTGVWPISRRKCLKHPEIGEDKPEKKDTPVSAEPAPEVEVPVAVDRKFILDLVKDGDRETRMKAKLVAETVENLQIELSMAKREIHGLKLQEEQRKATKKLKAVDKGKLNPTAAFMSMADLAATGQTMDDMEEEVKAIPRPKRARNNPRQVVVEDLEEEELEPEEDQNAASEPDEYEILGEVQTRSGRVTRRNKRYDN